MNVLTYLIPISLVLGTGALVLFLWSLWSGQYEDLDGAAERILYDEDVPLPPANPSPNGSEETAAGAERPPAEPIRATARYARSP
ncbi:cbb3-type cytochrome oxidase maturation protein [Mycoplana sp. BE70]|uniref:cbb3-type cytochrome oxidase assembly protein CcoS n=1 Tax=Mycoplana sp. BE70 TaxID=2817775 RepID=UPI002861DA0E|nr:cbb3-type cytochrome oxidase assembly protein CcoS [Mycoplana sp. BE70]MDR6756506.1 cbb3-type cytochrome oxidase maturation protein [Mycoplana sp. BE70]